MLGNFQRPSYPPVIGLLNEDIMLISCVLSAKQQKAIGVVYGPFIL